METNRKQLRNGTQKKFTPDDHAKRILSNLFDLKKNGKFCDVVLIAEGAEFSVHKVILAASCQYFSAMFGGDMSEYSQTKVEIKEVDVTSEALNLLLDFLYSGQLIITEGNVEDLLAAANFFGFTQVKEACISFLQKQLDPVNCIGIWQFAVKYSCEKLCEAALSYFKQYFQDVVQNDEIWKLKAEELNALIDCEDLQIDEEYKLLEVIINWLQHNPENNRKPLSYLLCTVKLSFIPPQQLDKISKLSLLQGDIYAQNMIKQAKICHCECAGVAMRTSCASWLYIIGGEKSFMKELSSIEYFDCKSKKWKNTKKMSSGPVTGCAVTVLENKLYVIGGITKDKRLNTVQYYTPESGTWKNVAHLSKCEGDVEAAILEGKIYVAGGSSRGQSTCSYVEKYCPTTNKWSSVFNMRDKRRRFALCTLGKFLYAVGGFDDSHGFLSSMEHYVPESGRWCQDAPMAYKRGDFGAVELSGYIYVMGGINAKQGSLCSVERYNPSINEWTMMSSMNCCRGGLATTVYCGKIFALNGMNEYMSAMDSMESYDETTDSWNSVASLSTTVARFGAAAVVYPYLIST